MWIYRQQNSGNHVDVRGFWEIAGFQQQHVRDVVIVEKRTFSGPKFGVFAASYDEYLCKVHFY
jgi:hypothetical protein